MILCSKEQFISQIFCFLGELQRKIGRKALDMEGNAIIGLANNYFINTFTQLIIFTKLIIL